MGPSLRSVGVAALACVSSVSAKQWYLADTYDATNFFDKFTFFSAADPNSGHVVYQSQAEANKLGLAKYEDNEVYLGPDSTNVLSEDTGRPSVRLQSALTYNHGLFIARFSHLPQPACGSWPAFWTVGSAWPDDGEIDIIEGWNLQTTNAPAFHAGSSSEFGQCKLDGADQTATVKTSNCDNTFSDDSQSLNQGCTGSDSSSPYGSADGGVYALEWTDSYIKLFTWKWDSVPDNLDSSEPDTSSWGEPNMYLKNDDCNIDNHFIDQTLIINIAFCGNPVGNADVWGAACSSKTGYDTCNAYVSAKPTDFADTYFKIKDIRYFKTTKSASSSSSSSAVESAASSSSSSVVEVASTPAVTATTRHNNGTIPVVTRTSTGADSGVGMTTSVVYTTQVHTVTSCAPTVTNCPIGSVVTKTVALYTTICPVTAAEATSTGSSSGSGSGSSGSDDEGSETITRTITNVHTVTKCASTVTNCPATLSTEYIVTTYPHSNNGATASGSSPVVTQSSGSGSSGASSSGFWPAPASTASGYQTPNSGETAAETPSTGSIPIATPPAGNSGSSSGSGSGSGIYTTSSGFVPVTTPAATPVASSSSSSGSTESEVPVTGGATKMGASLALILGAVAAMMI